MFGKCQKSRAVMNENKYSYTKLKSEIQSFRDKNKYLPK